MPITYQPDAPRSPEVTAFADVMRSVLHTRPDSPVDGPHTLETWTDVDGYTWQWTTSRGSWTVTAGAVLDPRPHLSGPAGTWTVERYDDAAARELVTLLRLAHALPPPTHLTDPGPLARYWRPGTDGPYPAQARYWRPGTDPYPADCTDPPRPDDPYVAVALIGDAPPGFQAVLLPDGSTAHLGAGEPTVLSLVCTPGPARTVYLGPVPDELAADQPDHTTAAAVIRAHQAAAEQTRAVGVVHVPGLCGHDQAVPDDPPTPDAADQ